MAKPDKSTMQSTSVDHSVLAKANSWLSDAFDEATRREVERMIREDENALIDAFYKDLEFGTGGLRGIMGVGSNKMNIYTVGMATQGLCNYLKSVYGDTPTLIIGWATWCGPCVVEMPSIQRLHDRYRAQGLRVVGVVRLAAEQPVTLAHLHQSDELLAFFKQRTTSPAPAARGG